jgi:hypothetical protein
LRVPRPLLTLKVGDRVIGGSNLGQDARYDQILHLPIWLQMRTDIDGYRLGQFLQNGWR